MLSIMVWNNVDTITRTHTERLNETAQSLVSQLADSAGVFMFQVDYASLEEYARTVLGHPEVSYVRIIDADNRTVIELGEPPTQGAVSLEAHPRDVRDGVFDVAADIHLLNRVQGKVYAGFTLALMEQTIREARLHSIAIALTEIILSIIATIWIGLSLTRGLHSLAVAASNVGEGNFEVSLPVERKDEVGLVANTFRRMIAALASRSKQLQDSKNQIHLLMNSIEEGIFGIDANGTCTFVNAACVQMLGYTNESELIGRNYQEFIHCTTSEGKRCNEQDCLLSIQDIEKSQQHSSTQMLWRRDNSRFPVEYWSHPVGEDEKRAGTVVTFIDISERYKMERELQTYQENLQELVAERTAELEVVNHELEAFSYSVSHDLRAPLRAIDGFSRALLEDYHARLDATGQDHLQRVCRSVGRMGQLIDDLLQLSRVSRSTLEKTQVDLQRLAEEAVSGLRETDSDREVDIHIDRGLKAYGDERLLAIVVENLFSNAWKFTLNTREPQIVFGAQQEGERVVFFVRDNGAGFDMAYADKLFGAFQRLHSAHEFEGTGIGLATVQRVIHRHGGRVWAESRPGEGATFYFTLSAA